MDVRTDRFWDLTEDGVGRQGLEGLDEGETKEEERRASDCMLSFKRDKAAFPD